MNNINVGSYSNPVFENIDGDGDLDLFVGEYRGNIKVFTNNEGVFTATGNLQADGEDIDVGNVATPVFVDIDGDEDLDLFVGEYFGYINVFINAGEGVFTAIGNLQADNTDIDVGNQSNPIFGDIDEDGDMDLYVGNISGNIKVFTNNEGNFTANGNLQADGVDINISYANPVFEDIDRDGDLDLFVGDNDGYINVFTNDGDGNFTATGNLQIDGENIDVGDKASPVFVNFDCSTNLYVGNQDGNILVFSTESDFELPTITTIDNQTIDLESGQTAYTVVGTEFDPTETADNCEVASITNDFNNAETLDGAEFSVTTTTVTWTVTDVAGNTATSSFDVTVNAFVNIADLSKLGISIYPNPSTGIFTVETKDNFDVTITDISGKIISEIPNFTNSKLDLSNQSNGIYFIKFQNSELTETLKIIKQ